MDHLSKKERSINMSKIRSKNTLPEIRIRKALWKLGYRYRLHYKKLPGKPDIVIVREKIAIFVHGCFWHRHKNCIEASIPKSNSEYWETKINKNIERDKRNQKIIKKMGWKIVVIWECKITKDIEKNILMIKKKLNNISGGYFV
jgi:DNA mismatch endonuclease (patch repair protein)